MATSPFTTCRRRGSSDHPCDRHRSSTSVTCRGFSARSSVSRPPATHPARRRALPVTTATVRPVDVDPQRLGIDIQTGPLDRSARRFTKNSPTSPLLLAHAACMTASVVQTPSLRTFCVCNRWLSAVRSSQCRTAPAAASGRRPRKSRAEAGARLCQLAHEGHLVAVDSGGHRTSGESRSSGSAPPARRVRGRARAGSSRSAGTAARPTAGDARGDPVEQLSCSVLMVSQPSSCTGPTSWSIAWNSGISSREPPGGSSDRRTTPLVHPTAPRTPARRRSRPTQRRSRKSSRRPARSNARSPLAPLPSSAC